MAGLGKCNGQQNSTPGSPRTQEEALARFRDWFLSTVPGIVMKVVDLILGLGVLEGVLL